MRSTEIATSTLGEALKAHCVRAFVSWRLSASPETCVSAMRRHPAPTSITSAPLFVVAPRLGPARALARLVQGKDTYIARFAGLERGAAGRRPFVFFAPVLDDEATGGSAVSSSSTIARALRLRSSTKDMESQEVLLKGREKAGRGEEQRRERSRSFVIATRSTLDASRPCSDEPTTLIQSR